MRYPYFQVGQNLGPKMPAVTSNYQIAANRGYVSQQQQQQQQSVQPRREANLAKDNVDAKKGTTDLPDGLDDYLTSLGNSKANKQVPAKEPAATQRNPAPPQGGGGGAGNKSGRRRWDFQSKQPDLLDSMDDFGDLDTTKKNAGPVAQRKAAAPALKKKSSFDWDDDDDLFG